MAIRAVMTPLYPAKGEYCRKISRDARRETIFVRIPRFRCNEEKCRVPAKEVQILFRDMRSRDTRRSLFSNYIALEAHTSRGHIATTE